MSFPIVDFETPQLHKVSRLTIFGATGDVTTRLFLPAIGRLIAKELLSHHFPILAIGRKPWSTEEYHHHVKDRFKSLGIELEGQQLEQMLSQIEYRQVDDFSNPHKLQQALGHSSSPFIAYLALPPSMFSIVLDAFAHISIPHYSRIIFEKPFGEDVISARELNRLVHTIFPEPTVFRIDHFLGKQTVRNIFGLRFANRIFEPIWNHQHIQRIEIIWNETLGLEGRAGYYDSAGALKDMIQNHLLQLLCLIGMEPPISLQDRDFRDRKVDLLRAVRRLTPDEVRRQTSRARYGAGTLRDQQIRAYTDEEGVDPARETETYAEITLSIDNWRWAGVPIMLRSGKAFPEERHEVAIYFKDVPHLAFGEASGLRPNVLRLKFKPDGMGLSLNLNGAGDPFHLDSTEFHMPFASQDLSPYGHLFLDVMEGDPTLFIRSDEVEELWRIIEPIKHGWENGLVPLLSYPAGTSGPSAVSDSSL